LSEPPEGDDLPAGFAEGVADRVGLSREGAPARKRAPARPARPAAGRRTRRGWGEEVPVAALLVVSVFALLLFPIPWAALGAAFASGLGAVGEGLVPFVGPARLDVLAAAAAALGAAGAADALLRRWNRLSPPRRPRVSST
jgi:hypothetical protein